MTLKRYADYRGDGVAWAPAIPAHWGRASLRWLADIYAGGTPDKENRAFWTEGTIPWLNSGAVNDWAISKPSALITERALSKSSARWIPAKSVVIGLAGQGKTKGTSARLEFRATCNQSMAAIVPRGRLDYRFLHFWLVSNYQSIRALAGGDKRDGLNLQHIASIECPLPPPSEQRAIADFLDRETADIDTLIQEQQRLIEMLRERRDSLVMRTLSRGLDPTVPKKASGIPILGDIPSHWQMVPSRYLCTITTGGEDSGNATDDGEYPFYVRGRQILRIDHYSFDCEAVMTPGDGQGGTGKVFHYANGPFEAHQRVYIFKDFRKVSGWYFYYFLSSFLRPVALAGSNTVTMESLRRPLLAEFRVALPPLDEQHRITTYLDEELGRIDHLIAETERFIELSHERRSALIAAAVTGQVDVRGEAA